MTEPSGAQPDLAKLEMTVTYLEMTTPIYRHIAPPAGKFALIRAENPPVSFYRFLYNTVGEEWLWFERRAMDDEALATIVQNPEVHLYVLHVAGVPAGYFELDYRTENDCELAYFGIMPDFIGQGFGRYLLASAVKIAWQRPIDRLWIHTCNFDHPRAISVYQKAGFVPYDQTTEMIEDPRVE